MHTHYLRYFEEVAREKSFTKAAKNLHISQQSLSEYIKRMEEHYSIQFFKRKPNVQLTHAGELFLEYVNQSLYQEERLLSELSHLRSQQKGRIRIGITPTRAPIFFPLIFSRFNKLYPLVELSLREDHTSYLVTDLTDGKIDFIVGLEDASITQNRMITATPLLRDRELYFLATQKLMIQSGFPKQRIKTALSEGICFSEIQNIPIILKPSKSKIHAQIAQEYLKIKAKPNIVIEASNILPLLPLCGGGNAGVFMSQTILRYVTGHYSDMLSNVLVFPVQDITINCDIALIHFEYKPISVHFSAFIEITKNVFEEFNRSEVLTG